MIAVLKEGLSRFERSIDPVGKVPAVRAEREDVRSLVQDLITGLESGQIDISQFEELALRVDPVAEEVTDPWFVLIAAAVRSTDQVKMRDILELTCGVEPNDQRQKHARRAAAILRTLGFEACVLPRDAQGQRERAWGRS